MTLVLLFSHMEPTPPGNVPPPEWHVIRKTGANVLAIGPGLQVTRFLDAVVPLLQTPVAEFAAGTFAPPHGAVGTLVLRDIGRFDSASQERLLRFLGESGGPRTVSTNETSLLDLVLRGDFIETLYYHLNVVTLRLVDAKLRRAN